MPSLFIKITFWAAISFFLGKQADELYDYEEVTISLILLLHYIEHEMIPGMLCTYCRARDGRARVSYFCRTLSF